MRVSLFTLGGTIAWGGDADGVVRRLSGADLVESVPGLAESGVDLDVRDARALPSASLTFADILEVVASADEAVRAGATGVVLTQGTDSLEETAYLVDLVWPHSEPIVITGAMRDPTLAGADGPANLLAAIRVASASVARDLGAFVVFNDEIHAARWVRKTHATSPATFALPDAGPLGHVIEGDVRILVRPSRFEPLSAPSPDAIEATVVPLHTMTLDDDATLLTHLLNERAPKVSGLVVSAFGVGHVPASAAPVLEELAGRTPVVLTTRTGSGSVLRETYSAVGGEADLQRRGLINAGMLHPYKARILLRLLLAGGASAAEVRNEFAKRG